MARGKPRHNYRLKRRLPRHEPYDRVLILCVGRTERVYFEELRNACALSAINIEISGSAEGQDPASMVKTARDIKKRHRKQGGDYESVWVVFDKDRFDQFEGAIRTCDELGFGAAWSVPCFEYWLLLHFGYSDAPFRERGGLTGAQCCKRQLRELIPDYREGAAVVFHATWAEVEVAIRHARQRLEDPDWKNEKNPSTNVHMLVEYLASLKKERN